jgi:invasion protein IalB
MDRKTRTTTILPTVLLLLFAAPQAGAYVHYASHGDWRTYCATSAVGDEVVCNAITEAVDVRLQFGYEDGALRPSILVDAGHAAIASGDHEVGFTVDDGDSVTLTVHCAAANCRVESESDAEKLAEALQGGDSVEVDLSEARPLEGEAAVGHMAFSLAGFADAYEDLKAKYAEHN